MRERDVQARILLNLSRQGLTLFRCNTGTAWAGHAVRIDARSIIIHNARPFHAGLTTGGSDIVGWHSVVVTQEMVGRRVAVFTAIECKTEIGRLSAAQENFLDQLNRAGGIAVLARSELQAIRGVKQWLSNARSSGNSN